MVVLFENAVAKDLRCKIDKSLSPFNNQNPNPKAFLPPPSNPSPELRRRTNFMPPLITSFGCKPMEPESNTSTNLESRLKSLLSHLHSELGILERIVYKNKNQHRRCPYFQALLKVRRDAKLLQSAGLGDILNALLPIIDGKKPASKALAKRQKKNNSSGKHNYKDRLLGVARLLSQLAELILKAAIQISFLLAKSFFTGFSLTTLTLLACLCVLVQQILRDVVLVFNKISSLSQKKHSVKLTQGGLDVFREYYPSDGEILTLECVWQKDKFVLIERTNDDKINDQNEDQGAVPSGISVKYDTIQLFNEENSPEQSAVINDATKEMDCQRLPIEEPNFVGRLFESGELLFHSPKLSRKIAFTPVSKSKCSQADASGPNKRMKLDLLPNDTLKIDNL